MFITISLNYENKLGRITLKLGFSIINYKLYINEFIKH